MDREWDEVSRHLREAQQWIGQGRADQAVALAQAVLRAESPATEAQQAAAMHCLAMCELRIYGRFGPAFELAQRAAIFFQRADDIAAESLALSTKAIAATRLGHHETAVESALLAIRLAESLPMGVEQVTAYHALGVAGFSGRNFTEARSAYQQAIQAAQRCDPPISPFELHCDLASTESYRYFTERNTGGARLSLGGLERHVTECQQLLARAADDNDISITPGSHANNLLVLALVHLHMLAWQGRFDEAHQALERFRTQQRRAGQAWMQTLVIWADAELALAEGRLTDAEQQALQMLALADTARHQGLLGVSYQLLSHVREQLGDTVGALMALRDWARREQAARSESLKSRVDVIDWQIELRQNKQLMRRLESDSRLFQRLALEDALTGLANRRQFEASMAQWLAADELPISLAMIDVDQFKKINDGFSHQIGDEVLQVIAGLLSAHVREQDLAARLAGDEFVLVLRGVDPAGAQAICERIRLAVRDHPWSALAAGLQVSLSLGLSEVRPGDALKDVMRRSDARMYEVKRGA